MATRHIKRPISAYSAWKLEEHIKKQLSSRWTQLSFQIKQPLLDEARRGGCENSSKRPPQAGLRVEEGTFNSRRRPLAAASPHNRCLKEYPSPGAHLEFMLPILESMAAAAESKSVTSQTKPPPAQNAASVAQQANPRQRQQEQARADDALSTSQQLRSINEKHKSSTAGVGRELQRVNAH